MATQKAQIKSATVFLVDGGVDLKLVMSDGTSQKVANIPFGSMKDFSHDRKKAAIVPADTTGSKHGDRGFLFTLGKVSFKLYPQEKGHFFGSPVEDRGPASTYDEMLAALGQ